MKYTTKYMLGYFEEGDNTSSVAEMRRFETLDVQLYALFSVLGNGIISGWNLTASTGLSIAISSGSGHVNFVAVESEQATTLTGLTPSTTNYIYAELMTDSYWNQTVAFTAYLNQRTLNESLYLGYVVTDTTSVTEINSDGRTNLGFINLILSYIEAHRHIGGTDNPPPIDLSSEVQGVISQDNLPDLDASIIQTGVLDQERLPLIDHITHLINQGTLTHAQLDSFIESLSITNPSLMGEVSTVNLLQLILALKHVYPDIDEYLVNEIAYIPGISPDNYVDWVNTTADVDVKTWANGGTHTITGTPSPASQKYSHVWNKEEDYDNATLSNVVVDSDAVYLDTEVNTLVLDEFSDLTKWQVVTNDLSSTSITLTVDSSTYVVPPNSAKLTVGNSTVEIAMVIKKVFDAMDWSSYSKIVFYLKTEDVQHGDIYFYINDAVYGTQQSEIKVLNRNEPTINIDTLQNGWQEITVDISSYERENINEMGFYVSSQDGWDTSQGFNLNIDSVYLTSGVIYKENGYVRVVFGNDFPYNFYWLNWTATIPTTSGLLFKGRTRVSNTTAGLSIAAWSDYFVIDATLGNEIELPVPSALYKYIEIEVYFGASTDLSTSAILRKIELEYYVTAVENSFIYDTDDDWNAGDKYNILVNNNSISISNSTEVNNIYYGTNEEVVQVDGNLVEIYNITGARLPRSTYQILNDMSPSFGLITGVSRGNNGNLWVCDTDNDRVLEVDKSGALVRGFFGSYLVENVANTSSTVTTTTTTTTSIINMDNLEILQALYNYDKGYLYIIFNRDLGDNEISLITNQYLKIGTNIFYLDGLSVAKVMTGFDNVLLVTITGANYTRLSNMLDGGIPSIVIASPYEKERLSATPAINVKFLIYNFEIANGANGIQITLDGVIQPTIYTTTFTCPILVEGVHTLKAQLINSDSTLNTNIEAIAESTFVVYNSTYSQPYVSITSPKPNQMNSSYPVKIEFEIENFPVLAAGQHLRYVIDSDAPIDYYSADPILISDLDHGEHTLRIYLVDKNGNDLGYLYGSATVEFIIGLNSNATVKYYCSMNGRITNTYVDTAKLIFTDVYSPFDVQYIIPGQEAANPSDKESVLIGKLTNDYIMGKFGV